MVLELRERYQIMRRLPMSFLMLNHGGMTGAACALLALTLQVRGAIGEVRQTLTLPAIPRAHFWAVSDLSGNHHLLDTGGRLYVVNAQGEILRQGRLNSQERSEVEPAVGIWGRGGMAVVGNDDQWLLYDGLHTFRQWVLVERVAGQGDWTLSPAGTWSIAPLLTEGDDINAGFGLVGGTVWLSVFNGRRISLLRINPSGPTLVGRLELRDEGAGVLDALLGYETVPRGPMAVEPTEGYLLLNMSAPTAAGGSPLVYLYAFGVDPLNPELIGRFLPPFAPAPERNGVAGGLWLRQSNTAEVSLLAVEPALLPRVTHYAYDQKGVFFTDTQTRDQQIWFSVDWGGVDPVRAFCSGIPIIRSSEVVESGEVRLTWRPDDYHTRYGSMPVGSRIGSLRLINADDQISPRYDHLFELGVYRGPTHPPQSVNLWSRTDEGDVVNYRAQALFPQPALTGIITFPSFFPFVGGRSYGVQDVQASVDALYRSHGRGVLGASGTGRLLLGSGFLKLTLGGGMTTEFVLDDTFLGHLTYPSSNVRVNVAGGVRDEAGPVDVFPQLAPLRELPLIGRVLGYLNERAKIVAETYVDLDGRFFLDPDHPSTFSGEIQGGITVSASSAVQVIGMPVEFSGHLAAQAQSGFTFNPFALNPMTLTLRGTGRLVLYNVVHSVESVHQMRLPDDSSATVSPMQAQRHVAPGDGGWRYLYGTARDAATDTSAAWALPYLIQSNPFAGSAGLRPADSPPNPAAERDVAVIGGLRTETMPVTATAPDGTMMIVWVQEVHGLPETQATDIYYSYFDGAALSTPGPVFSDTRADFRPKVAWHHGGKWVALWERVSAENLLPSGDPLADLETALPLIVPAYAVFDPATGTWSEPIQLMDTGLAKGSCLATGPTHDLAAVWIVDPTGNLIPLELDTEPGKTPTSSFRHARFDGERFALSTYNTTARGVFELDAAIHGGELRVATVGMSVIGGGVHPLQEAVVLTVHRQVQPDTHWETADSVGADTTTGRRGLNFTPRIRALPDGQWRTAWVRYDGMEQATANTVVSVNRTVVAMAADSTTLAGHVRFVEDPVERQPAALYRASHLDQFQLGTGPQGEAFVVYPDVSEGQAHLALAYQDPAGLVSQPIAIVHDDAIKKDHSLGVAPDGGLLVSYLKVGVTRQPETVDVDGQPVDVVRVEAEDTATLHFLVKPLYRDLTVAPVRHIGGPVAAGETVRLAVDVQSKGLLTAEGVEISLYASRTYPPAQSGLALHDAADRIVIAEQLMVGNGTMAGGAHATVEMDWTLPADGKWHVYAVLDPAGRVDEIDTSNNQSLPVMLDLNTASPPARPGLEINRVPSSDAVRISFEGFLEEADHLGGPWRATRHASPLVLPEEPSPHRFYRAGHPVWDVLD